MLALALLACTPDNSVDLSTPVDSPPPSVAPNTTARLVPEGGTYALDNGVVLTLPAGAVAEEVTVEILRTDAHPDRFEAGASFVVSPPIDFLETVTLLLPVVEGDRLFLDNEHGGFYQPITSLVDAGRELEVVSLSNIIVTTNDDVEEISILAPPSSVDVLFVVDNSASMYEEQVALANGFQSFFSYFDQSTIDYHLGVVSTDMLDAGQSGRLQGSGADLWIEPTTVDKEAVFTDMVQLGTNGSYEEQGRDAAFAALETLVSTDNAGFSRPEAQLHVVFVSDEEDQSTAVPTADFHDWMGTSRDEPAMAHAITGLAASSCNAVFDVGQLYLDYAADSGGTTHDLCAPDWAGLLSDIGFEASGRERTYFLLHPADPTTIEVSVDSANGTVTVWDPTTYTYDPAGPSLTFVDEAPEPGAIVRIAYLPL
jgi:hypothetical protein